ncbi:hypothetical protein AO269_25060, partial [Pseudomonas putida]
LPGLGLYIQHHLSREQDAHLWPLADGIQEISDYELDGGVEIGFLSAADQKQFQDASSLLFSDEQNMFEETLAYDLPEGSINLVNRTGDEVMNGLDQADRIHLHLSPRGTLESLHNYLRDELAPLLAASDAVRKVRLHLCAPFNNDGMHPPAPDVAHTATPVREQLAVLEIAFVSPLARRKFFQSDEFQQSQAAQARHIAQLKAFAVSGVYTYVYDGEITTAGLRGSRAAELIDYLGANNQITADINALFSPERS